MRKLVKITIQNEETRRVISTYGSNCEVEDTTICSELKKQIRETIDYPCEEVSQTLWNRNKEVKNEDKVGTDAKLEYVLLIKDKRHNVAPW